MHDEDHPLVAQAQYNVGYLLVDLGRADEALAYLEPARAHDLATAAVAAFEEAGAPRAAALREARDLLARHG